MAQDQKELVELKVRIPQATATLLTDYCEKQGMTFAELLSVLSESIVEQSGKNALERAKQVWKEIFPTVPYNVVSLRQAIKQYGIDMTCAAIEMMKGRSNVQDPTRYMFYLLHSGSVTASPSFHLPDADGSSDDGARAIERQEKALTHYVKRHGKELKAYDSELRQKELQELEELLHGRDSRATRD